MILGRGSHDAIIADAITIIITNILVITNMIMDTNTTIIILLSLVLRPGPEAGQLFGPGAEGRPAVGVREHHRPPGTFYLKMIKIININIKAVGVREHRRPPSRGPARIGRLQNHRPYING